MNFFLVVEFILGNGMEPFRLHRWNSGRAPDARACVKAADAFGSMIKDRMRLARAPSAHCAFRADGRLVWPLCDGWSLLSMAGAIFKVPMSARGGTRKSSRLPISKILERFGADQDQKDPPGRNRIGPFNPVEPHRLAARVTGPLSECNDTVTKLKGAACGSAACDFTRRQTWPAASPETL
jgi:hypothetical protein